MESTPLIVPISELRLDAAGVLRQASASSTPVYVTQRGRLAAVMLARPMYERLIREHEILSRTVTGDLDVHLVPGVTLEEVLRRGERALQEERLAAARELAAEARRLEEREREPPVHRPECTLGELRKSWGSRQAGRARVTWRRDSQRQRAHGSGTTDPPGHAVSATEGRVRRAVSSKSTVGRTLS